ncbi:MAG: hypothetical protein Q4A78_04410 [Peptostreptococcaceae bacterium]|nr:hypothetical protein [Peptostreptococcaceae bacterium]
MSKGLSMADAFIVYLYSLPFVIFIYYVVVEPSIRWSDTSPYRREEQRHRTQGDIASTKFFIFWFPFCFLVQNVLGSILGKIFSRHMSFIMAMVWFIHASVFVSFFGVKRYYDES